MSKAYQSIIDFLNEKSIKYQIIEHEPVYTCEAAAKVRGTSLSQGAKSLLLKADKDFVLIVMSGDKKLDSKKLKIVLKIKNLRFATPEEVIDKMDCEIGACYPFGNLANIRMFVDHSLTLNQQISFNPGVHDRSIIINYRDYQKVVTPEIINIVQ